MDSLKSYTLSVGSKNLTFWTRHKEVYEVSVCISKKLNLFNYLFGGC